MRDREYFGVCEHKIADASLEHHSGLLQYGDRQMGQRLQLDKVNSSSDSMHVKWNTCAHDSSAVGLFDSLSAMLSCHGNSTRGPRQMAQLLACNSSACQGRKGKGTHLMTQHTQTDRQHTHLLHDSLPVSFTKVRQLLQLKLPAGHTSTHTHSLMDHTVWVLLRCVVSF